MKPHWHNQDGEPLCAEHAGDDEGDLNSNETDTPEWCVVCGRLCEYTLTDVGVAYALDTILTSFEDWPLGAARLPADWPLSYWAGGREVDDVRAMAEDLLWYGLTAVEKRIVRIFLKITKDTSVAELD